MQSGAHARRVHWGISCLRHRCARRTGNASQRQMPLHDGGEPQRRRAQQEQASEEGKNDERQTSIPHS